MAAPRFLSRGWKGWTWPLALAATIVYASGRGPVAAPDIVGIDKVTHFFVFGLLASLVARNGFLPGVGWMAVLIVSLFGITDEFHQSFTPGRSVEVADWVADTLGAAVAVLVYARWEAYRRLMETPLHWRRQTRVEKRGAIRPNEHANDS